MALGDLAGVGVDLLALEALDLDSHLDGRDAQRSDLLRRDLAVAGHDGKRLGDEALRDGAAYLLVDPRVTWGICEASSKIVGQLGLRSDSDLSGMSGSPSIG
jgi:hypothetical protein